ncbi:MAG: hypothetical protein HY738_12210 [Bacteroidia bacterium]|nr:hypothetical protein [Bacteroidia bacterium]
MKPKIYNGIFTLSIFTIFFLNFPVIKSFSQNITEADLGKIIVSLKPLQDIYDLDTAIIIRFEITNVSNNEIKFCKRNCPLEGQFIADFFEIIDEQGKRLDYSGQNFQRMPPTEIEYITLGNMQMIPSEIDLQKGYKITNPGKYSLKFKGDSVNKLPDSEPVSITVQ